MNVTPYLAPALLAASLMLVMGKAQAQGAAIFQGADLRLGEQLIAQNKCSQCHATKVGGDGSAMYKPMERLKNAGSLRGMVDYCSTQLNLGFFPEDSTDVAAALNRKHYHFKE